jgi:hypothetical protein
LHFVFESNVSQHVSQWDSTLANEMLYAAIDIGTNSILLLVAQRTDRLMPSLVPVIDQAQKVFPSVQSSSRKHSAWENISLQQS